MGEPKLSAVLDLFDLHPLFDEVVCDDEVEHSKPDPQIFLLASQKLVVKPSECVVIEDSQNGKLAAQRAGMKCVGFKGLPHVDEDMGGSDLLFNHFDQLKVEELYNLY